MSSIHLFSDSKSVSKNIGVSTKDFGHKANSSDIKSGMTATEISNVISDKLMTVIDKALKTPQPKNSK
ncbi:MAG: hypothetical protein IPN39_09110 [Chitinophagaceae bacterium]|nr:hypothetical protein [Chitinophagaceae bacterium]